MKRRMLSILLAAVLLLCAVPLGLVDTAYAADVIGSGSCGDNVTWSLSSDGTFTISGTGDMVNYGYNEAPWYNIRSQIKTVIIEDGVTSIGNSAFQYCSSLTSVAIPNSVTSIGSNAFYYCESLADVYYDGTAADWKKITIEEGNGDLTNATLHYAKSAPAAPVVSIGNSASSGKPQLTWKAVPGAASYKVYRATSQSGTYSLLGSVTTTSYVNTGAKAGTTYYYNIVAVKNTAVSDFSNTVNAKPSK